MADEQVDFEESGDELEVEERDAEHDDRTTTDYSDKPKSSKTKGRGFTTNTSGEARYAGNSGNFESISSGGSAGPAKSVEGWIVFVTGIHQEAQEEDVLDEFRDIGDVKNIDVNIDRRTGYVKGYGMVEFATFAEAEKAIKSSIKVMGQKVSCSWCFTKGSSRKVAMK